MDQGRRNRWGPWTDWTWDGEQARYWRARQDTQGNFDYDFYDPNAPGPATTPGVAPEAGDPRTPADDLVGGMHRLDLGGQNAQYTHEGAYTYVGAQIGAGTDASGGLYGTTPVSPHAASSAKGTARPFEAFAKSKSKHSRHQRERERETGKEKASSSKILQPRQGKGDSQPPDPAAGQFDDLEAFYPNPVAPPGTSPDHGGASFADHAGTPVHRASEADSPDPAEYSHSRHAQEDRLARETTSSHYSTGESLYQASSSDQLDDVASRADPYLTGAPGPFYSGGEPSSIATADNYSNPAFEPGDGRATPKPTAQPSMAPAMVNDYQYQANGSWSYGGSREPTNNEVFTLEHSSRFRPGEVFKIMWCEPLGATGSRRSEIITNQVQLSVEGRQFYQGLRRFIIVANDEGHCTCVPILTYERQACTKRGVKPLKHGIVYQTGKKPRLVNNEPPLGFPPVRVDLYERTEQLVKESRVNYAKLTTVEHNFKVFFIGRVAPEDFGKVVAAVDECWERKRRRNNN
ncbi:uncharacterized protein B0T15DRAFT_490822 [Chaetomium strumarium]|uniref:DUF6590 domain-containing protein n=1 Tax=Chaetomium strumarium TaxID=1170767 RepID=A0AAJ0GY18_9PEZI|nr:hypothetical protein B0T15DRAFT_490822 [Chaetomium strumarium]